MISKKLHDFRVLFNTHNFIKAVNELYKMLLRIAKKKLNSECSKVRTIDAFNKLPGN